MESSLKNQDRVFRKGHKIYGPLPSHLLGIHVFGSDKRGVISYAWFSSTQILEWNFNNFVTVCAVKERSH